MMRWRLLIAVALVGTLAVSCGGSTKLAESWSDPTYTATSVSKILVVGLGESPRRVITFEDVMGKQFATRKVEVIKGSSLMTNDAKDVESFKNIVRGSGADLVTISRLVDVASETIVHPGTTAYVPVGGYYGMGPYWSSSYMAVNEPGYVSESKTYKVETNVYDVKSEKLVWSGLSDTTDPTDFQEALMQISAVVVGDLVQRKIVP
jgi:hypothetical protein